jgi:hypothetical protein
MKDYPALHSESNLIDSEERLRTTLYNKRDDFNFPDRDCMVAGLQLPM